jgi:hypothetical protein
LAIVVVGGSAKDIGKTALVCAVIAALKDFEWTAVKITAHDYETSTAGAESGIAEAAVWEETAAGEETDTGRYLAAGARRALLVTRMGQDVPLDAIGSALKMDRNIIFESNRIVDVMEPDVCIALLGGGGEMKPSFARLLGRADALVTAGTREVGITEMVADLPRFHLQSVDRLTPEMVRWLRSRVKEAADPH